MSGIQVEHLFVYGTLRREAQHPMHGVLTAGADFVDEAFYQGTLYLVRHYPGVVPSDDPADAVRGEVYLLRDATLLERLDAYEGIGSDTPEPHEYVRKLLHVRLANGEQVEAWVYLYNWGVDRLQRIASGDFLKPNGDVGRGIEP
jgi:gamma-glutamylcyclotransferase (GGCT)/AIG2-like uncharacterized protein YtfP